MLAKMVHTGAIIVKKGFDFSVDNHFSEIFKSNFPNITRSKVTEKVLFTKNEWKLTKNTWRKTPKTFCCIKLMLTSTEIVRQTWCNTIPYSMGPIAHPYQISTYLSITGISIMVNISISLLSVPPSNMRHERNIIME